METLALRAGQDYLYNNQLVRLLALSPNLTQATVLFISTSEVCEVELYRLLPVDTESSQVVPARQEVIISTSEADWVKARYRLEIIQPLLAGAVTREALQQIATTHELHIATLYRWKKKYQRTNSLSSLLDEPNPGPKGERRLEIAVEVLIRNVLKLHYLTKQKKRPKAIVDIVQDSCLQAGLPVPSATAVRQRILDISPEEAVAKRQGKAVAESQFRQIKGSFPGVRLPLDVIQIDHTLADIILVDEEYRQPIGRPWLTVATDVFSRMVIGLYLSYEHPGAAGTGICIANAILPKETLLATLAIEGEWPC